MANQFGGLYSNMQPFEPVSIKGRAQINGVPTFVDKLPMTIGGIAGEDLHFGRVCSIDPINRRLFVEGIDTGNIPKGIVMYDPAIGRADPAMNDYYFAGRPVTVITFGLVDILEYDVTQSAPMEGSTVWARNSDGVIAFNDGTDLTSNGYTKLNAVVYETLDPNGAKVFFGLPFASGTVTRETTTATATPVASTPAGAVAAGTVVYLTSTTGGAKIYYTVDGTEPDMRSTLYNASTGITISSAVTIKAVAVHEGNDPSTVLSVAYTIA